MYQLDVTHRDLFLQTEFALSILRMVNEDTLGKPVLYSMGDQLAQVVRRRGESASIRVVYADELRQLMARHIECYRPVKKDDTIVLEAAYPPALVITNILATADPRLPHLEGINTAPVFGADGTLHKRPGYSEQTRCFYEPPSGLSMPDIPARPTAAEIETARSLILTDLLGDFAFTGEAERAHAAALLLLPFLRLLIDGPTPLHLVEKPSPGTGATLMVEAILLVAYGETLGGMIAPASDEEMDKRIMAKLSEGARVLFFDNLQSKLDSSALAMALTAGEYEGRCLGKSQMIRSKVRCQWIATANNAQLSNEISRRTVRIRLDAKIAEPWLREASEFRHPNLRKWVQENRGHLIWAALVLGQAWITADRPAAPHCPSLGMYESWASVIGGVLHTAGIPGFLSNLNDFYAASNTEAETMRTFVSAWWHASGQDARRVADLLPLALASEPPLDLGGKSEHSQKTKLGLILKNHRDRQFKIKLDEAHAATAGREFLEVRVTEAAPQHNAKVWMLVPIS